VKASNWVPRETQTLRGFFSLTLETGGIIIHDCTLHRHANGSEWIGLPGKPQIDETGRVRIDPATGKRAYTPVVELADKDARSRFQKAAIEAVKLLLDEPERQRQPAQRQQPARRIPTRSMYRPPDRPTAGPALPNDPVDDLWVLDPRGEP
jgi:hypothetical protein